MASSTWTDTLTVHLGLALQVARRLPAGEELNSEQLNHILDLLDELHTTFMLQCEVQGFKRVPKGQE